jgi:hypothetical protein
VHCLSHRMATTKRRFLGLYQFELENPKQLQRHGVFEQYSNGCIVVGMSAVSEG